MWRIAARQFAAANGTLNASSFSLHCLKPPQMAWKRGLNKALNILDGHFAQQNRHITHPFAYDDIHRYKYRNMTKSESLKHWCQAPHLARKDVELALPAY